MKKWRKFHNDFCGIGSFIETLIALVIVISAVSILASQLPLLFNFNSEDELESDANTILQKSLSMMMNEKGLLKPEQLEKKEITAINLLVADGFKIDIIPICCQGEMIEPWTVFSSDSIPKSLERCVILRSPVAIEAGYGKVIAAEMVVIVW
ncbi:MAG: hypothetical protein QW520_06815 [Methanomassiliicoccales archaeon]